MNNIHCDKTFPPDWSVRPFSEAVYFQEGPGIRNWQYRSEGTPFVNIRCISEGRLDLSLMNAIETEEAEKKYPHFMLEEEDILVSSSGTIGKIATVRASDLPCLLNTGIIRMRPKSENLDKQFLRYFLASSLFQEQVQHWASGSVQMNFGPSHLKRMWICLPPLQQQRSIARSLHLLDDAIELNTNIHRLLEEWIGTALKSWFEEKENLPKGWHRGPLQQFVNLSVGGDWGEDEAFENSIAAHCLRGVDLGHLRQKGYADAPIRYISQRSLHKRILSDCDIIIATSGAGPCGRSLWAAPQLHTLFDAPLIYSNFCKRLTATTIARAIYIDAILREMHVSGEIKEYINGTSIPNLNIKGLLQSKIITMPDEASLKNFALLVQNSYRHLYTGEIETLLQLKEALLTKFLRAESTLRSIDDAYKIQSMV